MMEKRLLPWEANRQGIIAGEIIASIIDIKKKKSVNPVPSSLVPSQHGTSVLIPSGFECKHGRYEVYGDVYEGN